MHFASFEVVSVKDLKLYKGHLSFLWTLTKAGKTCNETGCPQPKWHHVISVLQAAASQKCYHMTRIFQPRTKTNGPWSEPKKSTCPRTSEMDSKNKSKCGFVVCTLIDNGYASLLFSQIMFSYCFCMLSEFAKVFERKADANRPTCRTEIVKQIGACKLRPDARDFSPTCRPTRKKSVIASQIFPRRGRFYSPSVRIPSQNGGRWK